jgi:outer membrane protein assembly factor BamD (BamD/ComL family)
VKRLFLSYILLLVIAVVVCAQETQIPVQLQGKPRAVPRKAQSDDYIIAERARRAETLGDLNRALGIWRDLLNRTPWQPDALQGVTRMLLALQRYDEAETFLREWIQKSEFRQNAPMMPADPTGEYALTLALGQAALARGDEARAWEIWNGALASVGRAPDAVRSLVAMLLQNRRWEDAERVIRDFRKDAKQPSFMALELASSLSGQMNWSAATEELLLFTTNSPNGWQVALNYLNRFPDDSAVSGKVTAVLRKILQHDRKSVDLWRVSAGFAHKTGDIAGFMNGTIVADSLSQNGGNLVLTAAEQLLNEGEVEHARRGFQRILAWQPAADVAARAELGLGRCLEELGQWAQAKQAYETFIAQHPNFKEVHLARFRIAEILLQHDHDAAAALPLYEDLYQRGLLVPRALVGLRVGDCHACLGDQTAAVSAWSDVVKLDRAPTLAEDAAQALLRIARANLWRDSTKQALAALDSITAGNPVNTAFNDAVLYTALLDEGGVYRAQRAFAEGDYATFGHEDSLAAARFDEAANLLKDGRLAEWARYSQAVALRSCGRPQAAVAVLDTFVERYTESVDLDRAKYLRALIRMEDLHDDAGALFEFKEFLIQHPRSMYLEQARRKARILSARVS